MYKFFESEMFGVSADALNWIVSGLIVLIGLIILYMLFRLITRPRLASGRRSKHARLAITDAASVDDRRKLVLVRRDDVEHLVMIGGANDLVIESDIRKNEAARALTPQPQPVHTPPVAPVDPAAPVAPRPAPVAATPAAPLAPSTPAPAAPTPEPVKAAPPAAKPAPAPSPATSLDASSDKVIPAVAAAGSVIGSATGAISSSAASISDAASSAVESVTETVASKTEAAKTSIGDDMDALLDEITARK